MSEPKFKRGDLVFHKASREPGVVAGAIYAYPDGFTVHRHAMNGEQLARAEFTGEYTLGTGFREQKVDVPEYALEPQRC